MIQTSFGLFLAPRYHQFSSKIFVRNHFSTELTNLLFRRFRNAHMFDCFGRCTIIFAIQFNDFQRQFETPVASHATPHFLARNENENPSSKTSRPVATSSLASSKNGLTTSTLNS